MRPRRARPGFTLVEILLAMAIASGLVIGLLSFFGDTLQRFVQQEDTLTGVRDLQLLLLHLRRDTEMLDGDAALSSSSATGTTFPKEYLHVCHDALSDRLQIFGFLRRDDLTPIPAADPLALNLPPGRPTERLMARVAFLENACAWVLPEPGTLLEDQIFRLVLNVRRGGTRDRILYEYRPAARELARLAEGTRRVFGLGTIEGFSARPVLEFITFPDDPGRSAELVRLFIEVSLMIRAEDDGGKMAKRAIPFTTKITPRLVNFACKARWAR